VDVNGTRYHLLLGRDDWARCTDEDGAALRLDGTGGGPLAWQAARSALSLASRLFQFPEPTRVTPLTPADRRGAARDRYGNWYWIDATRRAIRVRSVGSAAVTTFWPPPAGVVDEPAPGVFRPCVKEPVSSPLELAGLTVTDDHRLIVGVVAPASLLAFDLHGGGPPQRIGWPSKVTFAPFDLAPAPGGGVWVLDRVNARYWGLDRRLQMIRTGQAELVLEEEETNPFHACAGGEVRRIPARVFPAGVPLDPADGEPIAIEGLPDGTLLVLGRIAGSDASPIRRYRWNRPLGKAASTAALLAILDTEGGATAHLVGHDLAFVPGTNGSDDTLYVASDMGHQSYTFEVAATDDSLTLTPEPTYLPMRRFGGRAIVAAGGTAYYDFGEAWVPLVAQCRPRFEPEASLLTPTFDGREPGCTWHRLMLDGSIPPAATVQVWSRAADDPSTLATVPWQAEPGPYRRFDGAELPFQTTAGGPDDGTWELLFQRARGRYLQVRLTLAADGRSTPRLRALRTHYPRFSYLNHYLPGCFRADEESASFLDRFLANFEGILTAIEDRVASAQVLFDVRTAPAEALDWLAGWLGAVLDPTWDEPRRRLFLRHAVEFFRLRGTVEGLKIALRLAFDPCVDDSLFVDLPDRPDSIRIVEQYRTRRAVGPASINGTSAGGPTRATATGRWQPAQGGEVVNRAYRAQLVPEGTPGRDFAAFPIRPPAGLDPSAWAQFAQQALGFVPAATDADLGAWGDFLARRYPRVDSLNTAYGLAGAARYPSIEAVPLPATLPTGGAALRDWYQFETIVLAMQRLAHRFSVLLPAAPGVVADRAEMDRRRALAQRVVALNGPAHATFDVQFYWSAFRVGEARLGVDTLIDLGGRSPGLLGPMELGRGALAESYLAPEYPQDVVGRFVVGRDAPAESHARTVGPAL
jgi:phage tail-like protein